MRNTVWSICSVNGNKKIQIWFYVNYRRSQSLKTCLISFNLNFQQTIMLVEIDYYKENYFFCPNSAMPNQTPSIPSMILKNSFLLYRNCWVIKNYWLHLWGKIRTKMGKFHMINCHFSFFLLFYFLQLLVVFTIVVFVGGAASILDYPELWSAYSVCQGIQVSDLCLFYVFFAFYDFFCVR